MKNRRGFILILILAILGTLSFIAISFSQTSTLYARLGKSSIGKSKVYLLARSGVEYGVNQCINLTSNGFVDPSTSQVIQINGKQTRWIHTLGLPQESGPTLFQTSIKDSSGNININDGIASGTSEIGSSYVANAIDPWPETLQLEGNVISYNKILGELTAAPSANFSSALKDMIIRFQDSENKKCRVIEVISPTKLRIHPRYKMTPTTYRIMREDKSALCNLRVRRLLNAYGDVHRFRADRGAYPIWHGDADNDPTYDKRVNFTSSATADTAENMPPGVGLGDQILLNRPIKGYTHLNEVRELINQWGQEQLTQTNNSYLDGTSFFSMVSQDLTISSFVDDNFFRIKREFGVYENNVQLPSFRGDNRIATFDELVIFDRDEIDLTNLWIKHPIHPINLNTASFEVRAATFYSPTNVGYLFESGIYQRIQDNVYGTGTNFINSVPAITLKPPLFDPIYNDEEDIPTRIRENGILADDSNLEKNFIQSRRLMTLRDAMVLSRAYEEYCKNNNYPDSFTAFAELLEFLEDDNSTSPIMQMYEKAQYDTEPDGEIPHRPDDEMPFSGEPQHDENNYFFRQTYIEKTLPHIFSCVRRLPSWLSAPVALMSPYMQQDNIVDNLRGLYSVEDFVRRHHLPKAIFFPGGDFHIYSKARMAFGDDQYQFDISSSIELFETSSFRTQQDFLSITDFAETDSQIKIGPESTQGTVTPHPYLGVVGLHDRTSSEIPQLGHYPFGSRLYFDHDRPNILASTPLANLGDTVLSQLNTGTEYFLQGPSTTINPTQGWPSPYTYPHPGTTLPFTSYNQTFIDRIRTPSSDLTKTWRLPHSPSQLTSNISSTFIFIGWATQPFVFPNAWANAQANGESIQQFLHSPSVLSGSGTNWDELGIGGSPPAINAPIEMYYWELLKRNYSSLSWATFLSSSWSNGIPGSGYTIDPGNLSGTTGLTDLEGHDHTFFNVGALGSDLSAFNGVQFSSRGHGPNSADKFSDSLFFRPYQMIDPDYTSYANDPYDPAVPNPDPDIGNNVPLGTNLNEGLLSFWFRAPSGYMYGQKCLFHMTFWEHAELGSTNLHDPSNATPQFRSNQIYAYIAGTSLSVCHLSQSEQNNPIRWSGNIELPMASYPPSPTLPNSSMNYLGVPENDPLGNVVGNIPGSWFFNTTEIEGNSIYGFLPGTWHRIIVGWNFRNFSTNPRERFWAIDGGNRAVSSNYPSQVTGNLKKISSFNNQQLISFGEMPFYHHPDLTIDFKYSNGSKENFGEYASQELHSLLRFNSLIDDIDIRFGDNGSDTSWLGFSSSTPFDLEDIRNEIENSDFKTWRHDLSSTNEPKWVLDFSGVISNWTNMNVISLGARIYDTPPSNGVTYQPGPRVDIQLEDPTNSPIAENYASDPATKGSLFQKGWNINSHSSQSVKLYDSWPVTNNTRMALTYKAISPDGIAIDVPYALKDIPWIKEINIRYVNTHLANWPKFINWHENNR